MNDEAFWASEARLLRTWEPDRFRFSFSAPSRFSTTPAVSSVFPKILHQLSPRGELSEDKVATVLDRFSASCTRAEWTDRYLPILMRAQMPSLSLGEFNRSCPPEYVTKPVEAAPMVAYDPKRHHLDEKWVYAPIPDFDGDRPERGFIFITDTRTEILDEQFRTFQTDLNIDDLCLPRLGIESPDILIEFVTDCKELMAIDLIPLAKEFPTQFRSQLLEDYHLHMEDVGALHVAERFPSTHPTKAIEMYEERGYSRGLLCKPDAPYGQSEIVLVEATKFPTTSKSR